MMMECTAARLEIACAQNGLNLSWALTGVRNALVLMVIFELAFILAMVPWLQAASLLEGVDGLRQTASLLGQGYSLVSGLVLAYVVSKRSFKLLTFVTAVVGAVLGSLVGFVI